MGLRKQKRQKLHVQVTRPTRQIATLVVARGVLSRLLPRGDRGVSLTVPKSEEVAQ
jgi:hypothetical protein